MVDGLWQGIDDEYAVLFEKYGSYYGK